MGNEFSCGGSRNGLVLQLQLLLAHGLALPHQRLQ